jgi:hypothetical protein
MQNSGRDQGLREKVSSAGSVLTLPETGLDTDRKEMLAYLKNNKFEDTNYVP